MDSVTKKSSGLSTQQRGTPFRSPSDQPTTTEADMYNLPLEVLRERANKQLREREG
jgi:hypothetical protein